MAMVSDERTRFPYEYDSNKTFDGGTLLERFRTKFPLLTIVVDGHEGTNRYETFCNGQVYRVHTYTTQKRVLMKEIYDRPCPWDPHISCPVDTPFKFCVISDTGRCEEPRTLADIIRTTVSYPISVKFSSECGSIKINGVECSAKDFGSLTIVSPYEENFLAGNCINNGIVHPDVVYTAQNPLIRYAVITGIRGRSPENFKKHAELMSRFIRENNIIFDRHHGNPYITRLSADGTGTGNPLTVLDPALIPELTESPPPVPEREHKTNAKAKKEVSDLTPQVLKPPKVRELPPIPKTEKQTARVLPFRPSPVDLPTEESRENYYCFIDDIPNRDETSVSNVKEIHKSRLRKCSVEDVGDYLRKLHLHEYVKLFEFHLVDGSLLCNLTEEIFLKEFRLSKVETVRLLMFIETGHIPK